MKRELKMYLADVVRRLSEEAHRDTRNEHIREAIRKTGGVPVYADMGGILLITPDGDVWQYDPETETVGVEFEEKWRTLARARAARHFPELQHLAPQRPTGAAECSTCGGRGIIMENLDCGVCFGTGWVQSSAS